MNKNKFIKRCGIAVAAFMTLTTVPSCDYLDVVPDNLTTLDHAFASRAMAERYLATCYSYLPRAAWGVKSPEIYAGGECHAFQDGSGADGWTQTFFGITAGKQNVKDPIYNTWDGSQSPDSNHKGAFYKGIRDCNIFLEYMDEGSAHEYPFDMTDLDRLRWVGEVKFIKAYLHFLLLRQYGAITIRDVNLSTSATPEQMKEYRNPFAECVEYIDKLMLEAAGDPTGTLDFTEDKYLVPVRIEREATEAGRITKPIIYAARAKFLTTVASPLFNGNGTLTNIKDNRGVDIFEKCNEYDVTKWEYAADACEKALTIATEGNHYLLKDEKAEWKLSPELQLEYTLRSVISKPWNREILWGTGSNRGVDVPQLFIACNPAFVSKHTTSGSYRNIQGVDIGFSKVFYTANGIPIEEDATFLEKDLYELRTAEAGTSEVQYVSTQIDNTGDGDKKQYRTIELNYGREPRFYASIGFDGAIMWGGNGTKSIGALDNPSASIPTIRSKAKQVAGVSRWERINITGYNCKKQISYDYYLNSEGGLSYKHTAFPVIRLADIMLLRAECLNEISATPPQEVFDILDEIRARAGLKGVKESWTAHSTIPNKWATQDGMRSIIQQERRIELAFEGHALWDLLRWKDKGPAMQVFNASCKGWNIRASVSEDYWKEVITPTGERQFLDKNYLWPIKEEAIEKNPNIVQNPGW